MGDSRSLSSRRLVILATLCLLAGLAGTLLGRTFGSALQTSPAWVGPAVFMASIAMLLVGLLLLPAAVRARKSGKHGPAA